MSQVKFKAQHQGNQVGVMAGWDRPCQHYHLTIFDNEEMPIWTSTYQFEGGGTKDPEVLLTILKEFEITAPEGFADRFRLQEANVFHIHAGGEWARREF